MVYTNRPYGCMRLKKMSDNDIEEDNNMLNGINNNDNIANNNYINRESNITQITDAQKKYATSPFQSSHFIDSMQISTDALNLYQKEQDIKKFTSLALSDENDSSHLKLVEEAFSKGSISPFFDDNLENLLSNQKLWDDIVG